MTNAKIKRTIDEIEAVINAIKAKADAGASWTGSEKADIEKRIAHLKDRTNPRHTNLPADLEVDLKEIEDDKDKEQLTKEKADLEKEIKDQGELWKKLTPELLTSLGSVRKVKKNPDGTEAKDQNGNLIYEELIDLTELKTALTELKDKKDKELDLTSTNTKIEEIGKKVAEQKSQGLPAWVGYFGLAIGLVSLIVNLYLIFFPKNKDHDS